MLIITIQNSTFINIQIFDEEDDDDEISLDSFNSAAIEIMKKDMELCNERKYADKVMVRKNRFRSRYEFDFLSKISL